MTVGGILPGVDKKQSSKRHNRPKKTTKQKSKARFSNFSICLLENHSLCCPSLYPQMRGGEVPPLLAIVKLSTLQFPTVPAAGALTVTVVGSPTTVAKAGLAIVWDY